MTMTKKAIEKAYRRLTEEQQDEYLCLKAEGWDSESALHKVQNGA